MNKKKKYIVTLIIMAVFITILLLHRKHIKVSESCEFPVIEKNLPNENQQNTIITELEPLEIADTEITIIPGINETSTDEIMKNEQEISQEPLSQGTYQTTEKNTKKVQSSTTTKETTQKTDDKVTIQNTKEESLPVTQPEETQKETVEPETIQPESVLHQMGKELEP